MNSFFNSPRILSIILWLVMLHSLAVGIGLIFMPGSWMPFFGFEPYSKNFYQMQGGIFHIVMCVAYSMAAYNYKKYDALVVFSITAKIIAFFFLFLYFLFIDSAWMVIFSAVADGLMGLIILWAYRKTRNIS